MSKSVFKPSYRLYPILSSPYLRNLTLRECQVASELFKKAIKTRDAKLTSLNQVSNFVKRDTDKLSEVILLGRSNAGKSSLIQHLVTKLAKTKDVARRNRKGRTSENEQKVLGSTKMLEHYVKVSSKPGFTKELSVIDIGSKFKILDCPGYGYGSTIFHGTLIKNYLETSPFLKRAYLLISSEVGITDIDRVVAGQLASLDIPFELVFTKIDKLVAGKEYFESRPASTKKNSVIYQSLTQESTKLLNNAFVGFFQNALALNDSLEQELGKPSSLVQEIIATSVSPALNELGVDALRASICNAVEFPLLKKLKDKHVPISPPVDPLELIDRDPVPISKPA